MRGLVRGESAEHPDGDDDDNARRHGKPCDSINPRIRE